MVFVPAALSSPHHIIFLLWPESHTIILHCVALFSQGRIFKSFGCFTQTGSALLHSPCTCFYAPMKCNPFKCAKQISTIRTGSKKSRRILFLSFSARPSSVALSTEIEFPLGTTSCYLAAAWCCPQLNSNGVHILQNIPHGIVCVCIPTSTLALWTTFKHSCKVCLSGHSSLLCVFCVGGWGTT